MKILYQLNCLSSIKAQTVIVMKVLREIKSHELFLKNLLEYMLQSTKMKRVLPSWVWIVSIKLVTCKLRLNEGRSYSNSYMLSYSSDRVQLLF